MWFQDHQTVLVYHPGSGGEYICSKLNGQKDLSDKTNKFRCINGYPANDYLYDIASQKEGVEFEWSEECRLTFSSEDELKETVTQQPGWQFICNPIEQVLD